MNIRLDLITPSPHPIRSSWDEDKMNELTQSIREQGLIQPIKVRPVAGGYEIVYGHRRVEAARRAGFTEIDATVEAVDDTGTLIQALIENVQREDMAPLDTARALRALMDATGWSQKDIGRRGIMNQGHVSRLVGLLSLPDDIQEKLDPMSQTSGGINPDHVKNAEPAKDTGFHPAVLRKVIDESLSPPQTRRLAESIAAAPSDQARQKLIEQPFDPFWHNPEFIRERAAQYGAHDPLYIDRKPSPLNDDWKSTPTVAGTIDLLRQWMASLTNFRKADDLGKMAPEARVFVARRVREFASALNEWAETLETEQHG